MSAANKLVPELRFPEFQNDSEWSRNKLSLLAKPVKEKAKELEPEDVLTLSGEHGLVRQTEYFGKTIAGSDLKRYLRIEQNDFVYNDRTTSAAKYGSLKRLTNYDVGAVSPIYKCFRFKKAEKSVFWEHYFNAGAHENGLSEFVNEGARAGRFNISVDTFLSISVCYPSEAEQQKIADCLGSLDDLIAAHSRKLAALQDHKKGLLQQLFPAEGETTPKLRFPGFEGEWEVSPLGEVVSFQSGGTPSKADSTLWAGDIPWVSARDMKSLFLQDTAFHISQTAIQSGSKLAKTGTVLMLIRGMTLFKDLPICVLRRPMSFNQDVKALRAKSVLNQGFLPFLLLGNKGRLLELVDAAGHGTGRLNMEDLKSLLITYPQKAEQQKIADCLSDLDALITAQTEQIAALKAHKKGLMQKLFPNPELKKA